MALQSVAQRISVTLTFGCLVNVAASGTSDAIYSVMHENPFLPLCYQVVLAAAKEFSNQTSFFFSTKKKKKIKDELAAAFDKLVLNFNLWGEAINFCLDLWCILSAWP